MKIKRLFHFLSSTSMLCAACLSIFVVSPVLLCAQSSASHRAAGQAPVVPKLTLSQVEQLVSNKVPDSTLSSQVQKRGLAFAPTPEIVEALRAKGAGPLTLEAIEVLSPKGSHGATANRKEPPSTMQLGPGIITTVAGNGTCSSPRNQYGVCPDSSPSGDGGAATSVQLNSPGGVAVDGSDNLYITDVRHNVIRKVNRHGIITTIAGNGTCGYSGDHGPATSAQLDLRMGGGIAADALGNIYFGDAFQNVVRKVSVGGIITTVAGNGTSGYSGDNGSATSAQLNYPQGVAIDTAGNLYINDSTNQRIRKVSPIGIIKTVAGNGTPGYSGDNGPATNAQVKNPKGIAVDTLGDLFIGSEERIRKVSRNGIITTVAGSGYCAQIAGGNCVQGGYFGDGGAATMAQLNYPLGVAVDASGNIYIDDWLNSRIRRVSTNGIIATVAGNGTYGYSGDGGPAISAQLSSPQGVAVDTSGNLFIVDGGNDRIREVGFTGASLKANQNVAPGQVESEPSLAVTMRFIQDKMSERDQMNWVLTMSLVPGVIRRDTYTFVHSDVSVDSATCTLRSTETTEESTVRSTDATTGSAPQWNRSVASQSFSFKDIDTITIGSPADIWNSRFAKGGHPEKTATVEPTVIDVIASGPKPTISFHNSVSRGDNQALPVVDQTQTAARFTFRDEDMANRVAKAVRHAIELCSGGNKEPF